MQSNSELNRRVAEALGWRAEQLKDGTWELTAPDGGVVRHATTKEKLWAWMLDNILPDYTADLNAIMPLVLEAAQELRSELSITPFGGGAFEVSILQPRAGNPGKYVRLHTHDADRQDGLPRALCELWLDYADMQQGKATCDERGAEE